MTLRRTAARLAAKLGRVEARGPGSEREASYYDNAYPDNPEYKLPYQRSRYYFMWTVIVDRVRRSGFGRVLEIGCGPGQLAEFLLDQGVREYLGFDFSSVAVKMARDKKLSGARFECDDARTSNLYGDFTAGLIVCTEVLEHVEDDLGILSRIPVGTRCLCTVPSSQYESHVRHFPDCESVASRYQAYFDDFDVLGLKRPDSQDDWYFLFEGTRNDFATS